MRARATVSPPKPLSNMPMAPSSTGSRLATVPRRPTDASAVRAGRQRDGRTSITTTPPNTPPTTPPPAPAPRGPGLSSQLDRDGDGVACEKELRQLADELVSTARRWAMDPRWASPPAVNARLSVERSEVD